jgi:hypothetical protein
MRLVCCTVSSWKLNLLAVMYLLVFGDLACTCCIAWLAVLVSCAVDVLGGAIAQHCTNLCESTIPAWSNRYANVHSNSACSGSVVVLVQSIDG